MVNAKLEQYLCRTAAYLTIVLSFVFLLFSCRFHLISGLLAGTVLSILNFAAVAVLVKKSSEGKVTSTFLFPLLTLVSAVLLCAAYRLSVTLFFGSVFGVLTVPAAVMIEAITEAAGITGNKFFT